MTHVSPTCALAAYWWMAFSDFYSLYNFIVNSTQDIDSCLNDVTIVLFRYLGLGLVIVQNIDRVKIVISNIVEELFVWKLNPS